MEDPRKQRKDLEEWWFKKTGTKLPVYIPTEFKREVIRLYELITKKKYTA